MINNMGVDPHLVREHVAKFRPGTIRSPGSSRCERTHLTTNIHTWSVLNVQTIVTQVAQLIIRSISDTVSVTELLHSDINMTDVHLRRITITLATKSLWIKIPKRCLWK
ncbi:hypothetical protein XENOCAPTIV_004453 [Xenoophorus captivus]|uniref:Uncharacterized protein n=1 Tax=Xenoophorus captivus TaxID=1517983 RepID=A0ABV0SGF7_9TELE